MIDMVGRFPEESLHINQVDSVKIRVTRGCSTSIYDVMTEDSRFEVVGV